MNEASTTQKTQAKFFSGTLVAILMIFFLGGGNGWMQAAYQNMSDAIGVDYATVLYVFASIPPLLTLVFSIVSGYICGRWIPYKICAIVALALFSIGGLVPVFVTSWPVLIGSRVVYGIGCGLITPMAQALTMRLWQGDDNARVQGWGVTTMKIANIVIATIVGFLVGVRWNLGFLVYGFGLVALVLVMLTLPMDQISKANKETSEAARIAEKAARKVNKFPLWCYVWPVIVFVGYCLFLPLNMNMSAIIVGGGLGDSVASAMGANLANIGGIVAGLILGNLSKITGKYLQPIMFVFSAIGLYIAGWSSTLEIFYIGTTIGGFGFNCITAMTLAEASRHIPPVQAPFLAGLCLAFVNLSSSTVPFLMQLEYAIAGNTSPYIPIQFGAVGFTILLVVIAFFQWRNKKDDRGFMSGYRKKKDEMVE